MIINLTGAPTFFGELFLPVPLPCGSEGLPIPELHAFGQDLGMYPSLGPQ